MELSPKLYQRYQPRSSLGYDRLVYQDQGR